MDTVEDILAGLDIDDDRASDSATVLESPKKSSLPLLRRDISVAINTELAVAEVQECMLFRADRACNATFRFPLPPRAAVFR